MVHLSSPAKHLVFFPVPMEYDRKVFASTTYSPFEGAHGSAIWPEKSLAEFPS
jgi:hypothetical protein